jgi:hypothetical protein
MIMPHSASIRWSFAGLVLFTVLASACARSDQPKAIVTRGPYLQLGTPTSMVVRWRTDVPTDSRVRIGPAVGKAERTVERGEPTTEHEIELTGLRPSTRYFYAIGNTDQDIVGDDTCSFITAPASGGGAMRIWAIGDAGTANADQAKVRDAYLAYTAGRHTDVWLMLGDNAYDTGTDIEYQKAVFDVYGQLLRQTPLWSTLGNHDAAHTRETDGRYPYFSLMTLPQKAEAGGVASGTEYYYSFDHGAVHFICLDSQTNRRKPGNAMLGWLEQDLAATRQPWIVAFWHHPPYTRGSHNSDKDKESIEMRRHVLPILEAGGVDLVLTGHSHSYERSYLLHGHYEDSKSLTPRMKIDAGTGAPQTPYKKPEPDQGTVYVVAGSSGKISGGKLDHPAHCVSLNRLGSLVVDVEGDRMQAVFLRENGQVDDAFTIVKPTPAEAR